MKIEIEGIEGIFQEAEELKTRVQRTYQAMVDEATKMYKEIGELMPELTGNLKNNLAIEEMPGEKRVKIILKDFPSFYKYGTSKYFSHWGSARAGMHRSVGEHTEREVSRTRAMGRRVQANPKAIAMPFEQVLLKHGFTNIRLKVTGKNKGVLEATSPVNWPFKGISI